MYMISFSGESSLGPFWRQILDNKKTQTCRKPRKHPIRKNSQLRLYWKVRVPKKKKPIHFICDATCTLVEHLKYRDFVYDSLFAQKDGFYNCVEMWNWFGDPLNHELLDEEYDVIHFERK